MAVKNYHLLTRRRVQQTQGKNSWPPGHTGDEQSKEAEDCDCENPPSIFLRHPHGFIRKSLKQRDPNRNTVQITQPTR